MSRKAHLITIAALSCLLLSLIPACSANVAPYKYANNPIPQRETLVQISTIGAVLAGVYDGVINFGTLKEYGDFGIGTFHSLDGEMIGLDGDFYQVKADGIAYPVSDSMKTPFACVTFFDTDLYQDLTGDMNYGQFRNFVDGLLPTTNIFHAIKVEGTFSYMKTRSVPRQVKPYPPLIEITRNQPTFEFTNVAGTIVGFRCPAYVKGVNVSGYHLHFLTRDGGGGGHILDFKTKEAAISIDYTSEFLMILPDKDSDFYKIDSTKDNQEELEKVEK